MTSSIRLDAKMKAELRRRLARAGKTFSEYAREALAEKLARDAEMDKKSPYELGKHLFGKFSSGRSDLSVRYKEIIREKLRAKHSR
jgi:hypothetical protein